jgi:hypothetical protein
MWAVTEVNSRPDVTPDYNTPPQVNICFPVESEHQYPQTARSHAFIIMCFIFERFDRSIIGLLELRF